MRSVFRVLAGLAGALGLLIFARIWADPVAFPATLGITGAPPLGASTIRADVAGFFGLFGALALTGAIRGEARLLTAPALLIGLALAGRLYTVAVSGFAPEMAQPMLIEVVLLAIFVAGRLWMGSRAAS